MGRAIVISVGDELLAGRTVDTNATWLSHELKAHGFPVVRRLTLPDQEAVIAEGIRTALHDADLVVVSGGLGPTADDLTRDAVALALGSPLESNSQALAQIEERFALVGRRVSDSNLVQAMLPRGSEPVRNSLGTAPGILQRFPRHQSLWVLPGVPRELREMAKDHLWPYLQGHPLASESTFRHSLTVCGLPESEVGALIKDMMRRGRNPNIGSYPRNSSIVLVIEAAASEGDLSAKQLVERDVAEMKQRLPAYSCFDGDRFVHEAVAELLIRSGTTIAIAESLTAGRAADLLASVPGISLCLMAGVATYSNEAKIDLLGVPEQVIKTHGAVSEACAKAMAEGVRQRVGSRLGLSSTGIAGPDGGSPEKPVGTVYLALCDGLRTQVHRLSLLGDREQIRDRATTALLNLLRIYLLKRDRSPSE